MKLISHRGNINGRIEEAENSIPYISDTMSLGYDVEIDIWYINNILYLGHDGPQYKTDLNWLLRNMERLWIHCKDFSSLNYLIKYPLRVFYHEKENQTIINQCNLIWSHDLSNISQNSIIPLLNLNEIQSYDFSKKDVYGVCSDFVIILKDSWKK
jgi:hypothetical protein